MEDEARWIRMLKLLNVFPLVFCVLVVIFLIGFGVSKDILLAPIPILCLFSYLLIYFIEIEEEKSIKIAWFWALNLISNTFWLITFFAWSLKIVTEIYFLPILFSAFIVGYPLIMLYYNFRLFMNEISKPYDGSPNPSATLTD